MGGGAVVGDVGRLRWMHRAHRPAVDARTGHRDEEQPVEARIAAQPRLLADAARRQGGGFGGRHAVQASTAPVRGLAGFRSDEHTSELQSLMRISYAVFCLK